MAIDALSEYKRWESEIYKWQNPILREAELPHEFRHALFNELYYLTEVCVVSNSLPLSQFIKSSFLQGGTVWTAGEVNDLSPPPPTPVHNAEEEDFDTIGKFGYLESMEYLMVNTYDVHFYASWALAMHFPLLELSLQVGKEMEERE